MSRALASLALAAMALGLFAFVPAAAMVGSHDGVVQRIRIDSDADTPLCVATDPRMPDGAWACISPSRRHYQEMKEMLFRALDGQHRCLFEWTLTDSVTNRAQISRLTCSAP